VYFRKAYVSVRKVVVFNVLKEIYIPVGVVTLTKKFSSENYNLFWTDK